jgi:hypothetical protein
MKYKLDLCYNNYLNKKKLKIKHLITMNGFLCKNI